MHATAAAAAVAAPGSARLTLRCNQQTVKLTNDSSRARLFSFNNCTTNIFRQLNRVRETPNSLALFCYRPIDCGGGSIANRLITNKNGMQLIYQKTSQVNTAYRKKTFMNHTSFKLTVFIISAYFIIN